MLSRGGEGFRCVFEAFLYSPNSDRLLCTTNGCSSPLPCVPSIFSWTECMCSIYASLCKIKYTLQAHVICAFFLRTRDISFGPLWHQAAMASVTCVAFHPLLPFLMEPNVSPGFAWRSFFYVRGLAIMVWFLCRSSVVAWPSAWGKRSVVQPERCLLVSQM